MTVVTIDAAKTQLSKLVERAEGKVRAGPEFFEPLPEEELRLWEGEDE
jgi:hypothetical protein